MKGKIVLLPFPFTDLRASKMSLSYLRGCLPPPSKGDIIVEKKHPGFEQTGLKVSSVIKLSKVATILKDMVIGELGSLGPALKKEVNKEVRELYNL
jgi:mRNA interferase MazF